MDKKLEDFIDIITDEYHLTERELDFIERAFRYGKYIGKEEICNLVKNSIGENPEIL